MAPATRAAIVAAIATFLVFCAEGSGVAAATSECDAGAIATNERAARLVFEEILGKGRIDENEHVYHEDFVAHGIHRDSSRAEDRAATEGWRSAVPDLRADVLRTVANCEMVAVHWSVSGTNTGTGNGLPATGKSVEDLRGMTIFRMRDGQILEEWTSFNEYPMLQQLGLLPGAGDRVNVDEH